jgi:hypothetical protein
LLERRQRRVEIDLRSSAGYGAMTVIGARAQANVDPQMDRIAERALDDTTDGGGERAVTGRAATRWHSKQQEVPHAGGNVGGDHVKGRIEA